MFVNNRGSQKNAAATRMKFIPDEETAELVLFDDAKKKTEEIASKPRASAPARESDHIYYMGSENCGKEIMRLLIILSHKRPHGDNFEKDFVKKYISDHYTALSISNAKDSSLPQYDVSYKGPMENVVITCNVEKDPETLFSCHTDTVHSSGGLQKVYWHPEFFTAETEDGPLGADDGTGVWILMQMLDAGVPGTYVFHRGEERGCVGSGWMKNNDGEWLKKFKRAVAFDRREKEDVITKQRGMQCCSDKFASALATALNTAAAKLGYSFDYKPDPTGIYTDTANYTGLIPECTNLSVGYEGAHMKGEKQDLYFAAALAETAVRVDWKNLPTEREAKEYVPSYSAYHGYNRHNDYRYNGQNYSPVFPSRFASCTRQTSHDENYKLPWAKINTYGSKKEQKRLVRYQALLEDQQSLILDPPEDLEDLDGLLKNDRMMFARCFPNEMDMFIVALLDVRRRYIDLKDEHKRKLAEIARLEANSRQKAWYDW